MAEAAPGNAVDVGAVLGGTYEITGLIGKGGMGAVWAARHLRLPKRVAVKVLLGQVTADSEAFARFRREAEIASRLGHPNIVEVLDFDVLPGGTPYLVLELLDGQSLATRLLSGPLPVDAALAITRQIASALQAAHREGVVHRDLKPENVFLLQREQDGVMVDHVKVLDFGISKIQGSTTIRTQESIILGTPQYMAPEQATGRHADVDGRTDQFALGAMLYEMLSGRAPFVGQTVAEVLFKVVYEPPPPLAPLVPGVAPSIVAAIERALQKKLEDRFPDVSALVQALSGRPLATLEKKQPAQKSADAFAETIDSSERPNEAAAASAPARRTPWIVAGAIVVLGAAAGVGVWQLRSEPARELAVTPAPPVPPAPVVVPDAAPAPVATPPDAAPIAVAPPTRKKKPPPPKPSPSPEPEPPPAPVEPADLKRLHELVAAQDWAQVKKLAADLERRPDLDPKERVAVAVAQFWVACANREISSAHAYLRQIPRKRWRALERRCAQLGLEIEDPTN